MTVQSFFCRSLHPSTSCHGHFAIASGSRNAVNLLMCGTEHAVNSDGIRHNILEWKKSEIFGLTLRLFAG